MEFKKLDLKTVVSWKITSIYGRWALKNKTRDGSKMVQILTHIF
jgi:hypothetical protein